MEFEILPTTLYGLIAELEKHLTAWSCQLDDPDFDDEFALHVRFERTNGIVRLRELKPIRPVEPPPSLATRKLRSKVAVFDRILERFPVMEAAGQRERMIAAREHAIAQIAELEELNAR